MKPRVLVPLMITAAFLATASANAAEQGCRRSEAVKHRTRDGAWRIVATDRGYDAPSCMPAGLRQVAFENQGSDIHEIMFIKLPQGMRAEQYVDAVQSGIEFPQGALDYSGPGLTSPGHRVDMWLHLDPGRYLLFCWYRLHSSRLSVHALAVVADGSSDSAPPSVDVTIRQVDFRFEIAGDFRRGPQIIRFETAGPSLHEADILRLNDGKSIDDVREWKKSKYGAAPVTAFGGALDNHDIRRIVWLKTDLAPGRYVLWCGMPMSADSTASSDVSHADVGMIHEFNVD